MSGIFGIFNRNGDPVASHTLETMQCVMAEWGPDGGDILLDGAVGFGQMRHFTTPEAQFELMPVKSRESFSSWNDGRKFAFTAAGRLDNREELIGRLSASDRHTAIPDSELMLRAYQEWGENCPARLFGDWAFAVWHPEEKQLFLARDHHGHTALYYYVDPRFFVFASSRQALLALHLAPMEMDELYLAQVLVSSPAYHGERTIYKPVKRLPPAHSLTVTPDHMSTHRYWRLEDTAELHLPRREDYVAAFTELFDEAVRCRLRSDRKIAVSLSGGLDSGSVAATAAKFLKRDDKRLSAFSSAPLSDTGMYVGKRFGDEFSFAQKTADHCGNIDLYKITADTISPIQAIRAMLTVNNEPAHAAGNFFWLQAIRQAARSHGSRVLLTGQMGNAGISWTGSVFSQPAAFQRRHLGWQRWAKELAKQYTPSSLLNAYRQLRKPPPALGSFSALHPDLARRLNQAERMMSDTVHHPRTPLEQRCHIIMPGRSHGGFRHAENGVVYGLEIRDPTADVRVLAFTLSVPDHIFMDPKTGLDRWLIREAMKECLPDEVRLNRRRGRQAGDIVPRLRACAAEVETALDELACGPAAAFVNVPYMREVWAMVLTKDTPDTFLLSLTVLTRGIMAGLWVNGFYHVS
ncbi:asparagine synthetase B family protein [Geotalea uraniireducens]|nr:asparagine synthase-related protein [Geotalea uraniireducens]